MQDKIWARVITTQNILIVYPELDIYANKLTCHKGHSSGGNTIALAFFTYVY